ncbi:hypothetical protein ACFV2H_05520 [Streptomyces sp. NPDC059629]|uniref:hypothetical protein n=1 Tax=Streptomyces sp. NPDC059629 TaxID=3346889 RepID=UPI0036BB420B
MTTAFGIRSLVWSGEAGFQLNGETAKITGGCVHHDHGPMGAVALDRSEERRVELLEAAGFNAVRTAHNPPPLGTGGVEAGRIRDHRAAAPTGRPRAAAPVASVAAPSAEVA